MNVSQTFPSTRLRRTRSAPWSRALVAETSLSPQKLIWAMVIRKGENISPLEIENSLLRHPAVKTVSIVGAPDAERGEMVVAFVVTKPGTHFGMAEMTAHLEAAGFARQKFPERLEVVGALPTNSVGKIQKPELRKIAAGLVPMP